MKFRYTPVLSALLASALLTLSACSSDGNTKPDTAKAEPVAKEEGMKVKITPEMESATITINGVTHTIQRNQDAANTVNPDFAKTSRKCPPFCIKEISLGGGVETIGELEVIDYLQKISAGDNSVLVIDNRTPDWVEKGTIPGAINVPFTKLRESADPFERDDTLKMFGATETDSGWNFSNAKTLILFCNGMWCGQSPAGIAGLRKMGYPASKIKWYRGGMQDWEVLGLTTVKPTK